MNMLQDEAVTFLCRLIPLGYMRDEAVLRNKV